MILTVIALPVGLAAGAVLAAVIWRARYGQWPLR